MIWDKEISLYFEFKNKPCPLVQSEPTLIAWWTFNFCYRHKKIHIFEPSTSFHKWIWPSAEENKGT